jgi:hypothetical protein
MRNFFLIKHHQRGLTEAYQENSCRTHAPRHTLPAFAGRHDDENLISLTRPSVNNPNPIMQSGRVVLGEQGGFGRRLKQSPLPSPPRLPTLPTIR